MRYRRFIMVPMASLDKKSLYHGSPKLFSKVNFGILSPTSDFGRGFYLTTDINYAEKHAFRARRSLIDAISDHYKAKKIVKEMKKNGTFYDSNCYIWEYEFDLDEAEKKGVSYKIFHKIDEEWARFVLDNVHGISPKNEYDIIIGPFFDHSVDRINIAKEYPDFDKLNPDEVKELLIEMNSGREDYQYAFFTPRALKLLKRSRLHIR